MIKRFVTVLLVTISVLGIIPTSVSASGINPDILPYYNGIIQEMNDAEKYHQWALKNFLGGRNEWIQIRNGCLHTLMSYMEQWMKYAYLNSDYVRYTMDIATRLFKTQYAWINLKKTHVNMVRDFVLYLAGELSRDEFQSFMEKSLGNSGQKFYKENAELIARGIVNASEGITFTDIANLDSANFDMVLTAFLGVDFNPLSAVKSYSIGSLKNVVFSTAVNTALHKAALADGYKIVYGSKADELLNLFSNAVFSGSPVAWTQFYVKTVSAPSEYLNGVFADVQTNFTEEMKQLEQNRTSAGHRAISMTNMNIFNANISSITDEQLAEIVVDEIEKCGKILQELTEAETIERIKEIEESLYVNIEPVELNLEGKINIASYKDISNNAYTGDVKIFKDGTDVTADFTATKNGNHAISVAPKNTPQNSDVFKVVYIKDRVPVIHTVKYSETAEIQQKAPVTFKVLLSDGTESEITLSETDTVSVENFDSIKFVSESNSEITYDAFGNAFVKITDKNGTEYIYSIKKKVNPDETYNVSVINDGENSVKITCDVTESNVADNMYVTVYDETGKLLYFEKFNSETNNIPYPNKSKLKLIFPNMNNMIPAAKAYAIK